MIMIHDLVHAKLRVKTIINYRLLFLPFTIPHRKKAKEENKYIFEGRGPVESNGPRM